MTVLRNKSRETIVAEYVKIGMDYLALISPDKRDKSMDDEDTGRWLVRHEATPVAHYGGEEMYIDITSADAMSGNNEEFIFLAPEYCEICKESTCECNHMSELQLEAAIIGRDYLNRIHSSFHQESPFETAMTLFDESFNDDNPARNVEIPAHEAVSGHTELFEFEIPQAYMPA